MDVKYKNPDLPVAERVEDLLSRMTVEEKLSRLHCTGSLATFDAYYREMQAGQARMDSSIDTCRDFDPAVVNRLQEYCVNRIRLGIPLLVAIEGIHGGVCRVGVTVTNTGDYDADHSVLIFARNVRTRIVSGVVKKLVAFRRVHIPKGESLRVCFDIPMERFSYIGVDMKRVPAHGQIEVYAEEQTTSFEVGRCG